MGHNTRFVEGLRLKVPGRDTEIRPLTFDNVAIC
jgi:hypothetical protein